MGSAARKHNSEEAKKRNKEIDDYLEKSRNDEISVMKLLLLGGPECGKTTISKQMQIIHKNGFTSDKQLAHFRKLMHLNAVQAIQQLLKGAEHEEVNISTNSISKDISKFHRKVLVQADDSFGVDIELADIIEKIWKTDCIQKCFTMRHHFELLDSAKYILDKVNEICYLDYIPSAQDVLRTRVATTGMNITTFNYKKSVLRMVDVGGQKSERRKWIHCFDDVKVILFMVDITGYCKHTNDEEDGLINNLKVALKIFSEIASNQLLVKASILLFLNKVDIFNEILPQVPLRTYFSHYDGANNVETAKEYIKEMFLSVAPPKRRILPYFTTATNTENVKMVFQACMDSVLHAAKATSGL